ncbi:MAG: MFS transporter, partial [Clostridia bacterium]|nr:MFS transporter [Clostridia bacterium]
FLVSGLVTAGIAIPCILFMKRMPVDYDAQPMEGAASEKQAPISHLLLRTNLILLLITCIANGYVRDGITNWAAKLLMDTQGIDLSSAVGIILIIPAVNFLGIRLGQVAYKRSGNNSYLSSVILYAVCTVLCAVLPATLGSLWPFVIVLVGISAMTYGLNPLLTTIMPMQYSSLNRVALAAGMLDAMIYVGSSFSGAFAGFLSDQFGWAAVFVSWAVLSLIGSLVLVWAQRVAKKNEAQ